LSQQGGTSAARRWHCNFWDSLDYQYEAVSAFDFGDQLHHERTVPLRLVCGHRRSDRQLQHGGVLTFAQLRQ
jgi:hypothetical protein